MLAHAKDSIRKSRPELKRVTIAGDFRRGCELVRDLAIVAETTRVANTSDPPAADGLQIRLSDRKHFGAALLFATGSAAHIEELRALAAEEGMRLEADGLHEGRTLIGGDEADIYRALGLPFIDPELREVMVVLLLVGWMTMSPAQGETSAHLGASLAYTRAHCSCCCPAKGAPRCAEAVRWVYVVYWRGLRRCRRTRRLNASSMRTISSNSVDALAVNE